MNRPPLTAEQLRAVRDDARRLLALGESDSRLESVRQVAATTLQALDERDDLIEILSIAVDELGGHFRSESLVEVETAANDLLRRIGALS